MKNNWQIKLMQFMKGRYGRFDALNKCLLILALVMILIPIKWLTLVALVFLGLGYSRFLSKRIYVRSNENQRYLGWIATITRPFKQWSTRFKNRKAYVYFRCPECKQSLRAPRGKGKIKVTCSSCKHSFIKKV